MPASLLGIFQPMTEQRLPAVLIKKGWVTKLAFLLTPLGVMPPGGFGLVTHSLGSSPMAGQVPAAS